MSNGRDDGRNRYEPPRSAVADPADVPASPRPRSVGVAVLLMVASLLLSVATDAPVLLREVSTGLQPIWMPATPTAVAAGIVSTALDAVGLALVFTPPGSGWFRAS